MSPFESICNDLERRYRQGCRKRWGIAVFIMFLNFEAVRLTALCQLKKSRCGGTLPLLYSFQHLNSQSGKVWLKGQAKGKFFMRRSLSKHDIVAKTWVEIGPRIKSSPVYLRGDNFLANLALPACFSTHYSTFHFKLKQTMLPRAEAFGRVALELPCHAVSPTGGGLLKPGKILCHTRQYPRQRRLRCCVGIL
ncbi:hypothetical protein HOY82DRAFT_567338 [Tuber indicum]|nr:hypothetical protein HOY82DRAFT_567338 [Tuber indicum]